MEIKSISKGRTEKVVTIVGISQIDTLANVVDAAMTATGENRSSLFGWSADFYGNDGFRLPMGLKGPVAKVYLHTD